MDGKQLLGLSKNLNVLYIEDDPSCNEETFELLSDFFNKVDTAFDGREGFDKYYEYFKINNKYYDLVITDINMPRMNGISLCKNIYELNEEQPIIVVSAHNDSEYLMELINIGIERFLLKPFNHKDIIDVVCNVLKKRTATENKVVIGEEFIWNKENETLIKDNEIVKLTQKELELLKLFIKNGSRISLTQEIFNYVWDDDSSIATTDALKSLLSRLRKKLGGIKIESIYNLGYRLNF